jgi:hypothetical protein
MNTKLKFAFEKETNRPRRHRGFGSLMADPREGRAGAYCRADCCRDKNDARVADETWRRDEIAPFGMKVRAVTHFTHLGFVSGTAGGV